MKYSCIPTVKLVTRFIRSQAGEMSLFFLLENAFRGSGAFPGFFPDYLLFILAADMPMAASSYAESVQDKLFGESNTGLLASR